MKFIRASHIACYVRSPFLLWAGEFADENDQDPEDAFQNMLIDLGNEHEQEVIAQGYASATEITYDDAQEGFKQILALLHDGVESITQAPLFWNEQRFQGRPDILERREGASMFGDHHYVVKEIKYAKNIKLYHILQAAFYNKMLGHIQGYVPEEFFVINNDADEFAYRYEDYEELLEETIAATRSILEGEVRPTPIYGEDYPWSGLSKRFASKADDLSLLAGIGRSIRDPLNAAGISTLQEFIDAPKESVLAIKGVGAKRYAQMLAQAEVLVSKTPARVREPVFADAPIRIFFDIEGETQLDIDYLYGLLIDGEFVSFWASNPEDEEQMWRSFCSFIASLNDDFVLYHYAPYERTSIKKLYRRYGCDEQLYKKILSSLCDLHRVLSKAVLLPLTSYSIKPVAKYLGFSWRAEDAGGANSMQWYQQYLAGDEAIKQKILEYNEDDVRATKQVLEYLITLKDSR